MLKTNFDNLYHFFIFHDLVRANRAKPATEPILFFYFLFNIFFYWYSIYEFIALFIQHFLFNIFLVTAT